MKFLVLRFPFLEKKIRSSFVLLKTQNSKLKTKGFTLIELLVVSAIVVMLATVILSSQGKFGGQVLLQNFAYDVALSIRQAQVYGISVLRFGSDQQFKFNTAYGAHFDTSSQASQFSYVLFADRYPTPPNSNGFYDASQGELVKTMSITRGYKISRLCAPAGADPLSCTQVTRLDLLFVRPEPDALIAANGVQCYHSLNPAAACKTSARIVLLSPRGETMSVTVSNNGQIAVDQRITN